jgi:hypothetical protein
MFNDTKCQNINCESNKNAFLDNRFEIYIENNTPLSNGVIMGQTYTKPIHIVRCKHCKTIVSAFPSTK